MKTQLRIMATVVGILVSGVVVAMPSQPAHSTLTVNPGASAGTQSTGGQIEFSGSITDTSCNIDSTSANQIVDLGKWASSYFTGAGSETTKTAFHIKVKDCPATVTKVSVLFDGTRDSNNSNLLAVNGGAQGVAIKLYEDDKEKTFTYVTKIGVLYMIRCLTGIKKYFYYYLLYNKLNDRNLIVDTLFGKVVGHFNLFRIDQIINVKKK